MSVDCLRDDVEAPATSSSRTKRRPNHQYRIHLVKNSCWYVNYLKPGETHELTHDINSTDHFGEFRAWLWMSLDLVEKLTKKPIARGYLPPPCSLRQRAEYPERCELLIMSALYILGTGAGFRMVYSLTHISVSKIEKFFHCFLDIFMDMQYEYISLPLNLTALTKISKWYSAVGLPGACGSMDVVHVKWSNFPAGDHNRAKGKEGYTMLGFQCITDFNWLILAVRTPVWSGGERQADRENQLQC